MYDIPWHINTNNHDHDYDQPKGTHSESTDLCVVYLAFNNCNIFHIAKT